MQNLQIIIDKIQKLCDKKGISVNRALKESAVGKDLIANMLKGRIPAANKIADLAIYFGVSTDYLLGLAEQKENKYEKGESNMKKWDYEILKFIHSRDSVTKEEIASNFAENIYPNERFEKLKKDQYINNFFTDETISDGFGGVSNKETNKFCLTDKGKIELSDYLLGLSDKAIAENLPLTYDEKELLDDYRELSRQGKEYIRQTMMMAVGTYKKDIEVSKMEIIAKAV
ncbi:MAG: hypothetical protein FWH10_00025 [Oscillospiraceae bacterium]|nr:hypothetical protein [Oscillospiraceae bacterium]